MIKTNPRITLALPVPCMHVGVLVRHGPDTTGPCPTAPVMKCDLGCCATLPGPGPLDGD